MGPIFCDDDDDVDSGGSAVWCVLLRAGSDALCFLFGCWWDGGGVNCVVSWERSTALDRLLDEVFACRGGFVGVVLGLGRPLVLLT